MQKVWFITGASSGFGDAFARYALAQGHLVVATARNPAKLQALSEIAPDRILTHKLDVTEPNDAVDAVEAALRKFGRIDVFINNAGYGIVGAVEETPEPELRAQLETNFFGAVRATNAVLPVLRQQRNGAIVMISSLGGQLSFAGFGAYSASKFALEGLSEALAQEVAPFGIKVLIVEPGAFRTSLASESMKHMPILDAYRDTVGLTRSYAHGMDGTQAGAPYKAAAAIDRALQAAEPPLRLQLGKDAVDAVRAHAQGMLNDISVWEDVAVDTLIDD